MYGLKHGIIYLLVGLCLTWVQIKLNLLYRFSLFAVVKQYLKKVMKKMTKDFRDYQMKSVNGHWLDMTYRIMLIALHWIRFGNKWDFLLAIFFLSPLRTSYANERGSILKLNWVWIWFVHFWIDNHFALFSPLFYINSSWEWMDEGEKKYCLFVLIICMYIIYVNLQMRSRKYIHFFDSAVKQISAENSNIFSWIQKNLIYTYMTVELNNITLSANKNT